MAAQPTPGLAARLLALRLIERIDEEGTWLSRVFGLEVTRARLEGPDKALVMNLCQTVLRRRPALRFVVARCTRKGGVKAGLERILHLGLAQILFLDRVPDHAAVDLAVRAAKKAGHHRYSGLVNGLLRRVVREKSEWLAAVEDHAGGALLGPAPEALFARWVKRLGADRAIALQRRLAEPAVVDARLDRGDLAAWCERLGAEPIPGAPDRMRLPPGDPSALAGFASGDWTVQDRNAARIVPLLPPGGRRVADLCAAPGGKTTQLALLHPSAQVLAFELHEHRAELVSQALERCQLRAEVIVGDAAALCGEHGPFDRIVLDAPCTGLGTLRRHPEIGQRRRLKELRAHSKTQRRLLQAALDVLQPGGSLVYSVCSLEPEEGEEVIAQALAQADVRLVERPGLPAGQGCFGLNGEGDGFYVAVLERFS